MDRFSVIIPCWIINQELLDLTQAAVESFTGADLIIVDNASTMGGGYLRSVAKTYIRNDTNLGFAKAVNQGIKLAQKGSYITVANNDIRVSFNWKEVAKQVFDEGKDIYSCHLRMLPYDEPFNYGNETFYGGKERWCHGSFFVINKDLEPQLYDENYLNSLDDWDLFNTVRRKGYKTAYTNKAAFQHKDSSSQQFVPTRNDNDLKNREYFKSKWGEDPEALFEKTYPEQMKYPWKPFI